MPTRHRKKKTKNANTNFILYAYTTWLYFVFPNSFVFPYFNSRIFLLCLFIWYLIFFCNWFIYFGLFCSKHSIDFENMYLLSCWFHCVDVFYMKLRFCESYKVVNSVNGILLIEALSNFTTIKEAKWWFTL